MLTKIKNWFIRYDFEICWFLTGWFTSQFFVDFSQGNWLGCLIDLIIVVINVAFRK